MSRDRQNVIIRLRDNGTGISPELLPHIFDLFTQADPAMNRAHGGLGIGLTVVRRLVELHGGRVDALSEGMGYGSEFVVRLPLRESPAQGQDNVAQVAPAPAAQTRQRILVVDDNLDHLETLTDLLELENFEVLTASSGLDALAKVQTSHPDVVLLDINMPGMDGYSVARYIRELPGGSQVVLAALSGYGQPADLERSKEAGFDYHLVKPVDFARLLEICSHTSRSEA